MNTAPNNLKNTICKKGHVVQRLLVPYVLITSILTMSTSIELIWIKLNMVGYPIFLEVFEDRYNEKYLKYLMTLQCLIVTEGVEEKLLLATRELQDKNKILKALRKLCTGETLDAKELHLMEISEAEAQVIDQQALEKVTADATYDLFRQFVCGKAQTL